MRSDPLRARRFLVGASLALVAYSLVAFVVAMTQEWPGEFDTDPADDPRTLGQWIVRGSLLAPPLAPFVVQLLLTFVASRRRTGWILVGATGLFLLGAIYTIATIGEPLDPERSDPPIAVYFAFRVVGLSLLAALLAGALWTIVRSVRVLRGRTEP